MPAFAPNTLPKPPYFAVIFSSIRTEIDGNYSETAVKMVELARKKAGFLGVESYREDRDGITVSYWRDEKSIAAWKADLEHQQAQLFGREKWYHSYTMQIARVERAYEFTSDSETALA